MLARRYRLLAILTSNRGSLICGAASTPTHMESRLFQPSTGPSVEPDCESKHADWFNEEVLPHEPALRSWLRVRFPFLSESDDVVQESYVRIIRARQRREVTNTKSYLFMVARNVVVDLFRRNRATPLTSVPETEKAAVIEDRVGVAEAVCASQEFEVLRQAVDALPERCRKIMMLRRFHGLPNHEIAEQLGLSVNTVNAQLVIGLARCRAYLLARGVLRGRHP